MDRYIIRANTADYLYTDFIIDAENIKEAKEKAEEAFRENYPFAGKNVRFSLVNPDEKKIVKMMEIIKEEK